MAQKIKCLIVDDEPPARQLLVSYLSKLEGFEITSEFGNAVDAFAFLQRSKIDLMFLDIQMPHMNGIELIRSLHRAPQVVLTTAFREYALEGFELDVLDYLVKPISFERFMKTISKYHQYFLRPPDAESRTDTFESAYIFVKVDKDQVKVFLKDILFIESIKDYLKVVTKDTCYITYHRLSSMEEKLPEEHFLRIHKSFIVSLDKITSFRNNCVKVGDRDLPIGRMFRKRFQDIFPGC